MDWKTDPNIDESEVEPYSSFQSNKTGKLIDRMEIPIILVGAGLMLLVVLFVLFIPKKSKISLEDYKHIVLRLDQLEDEINDLKGSDVSIQEFDPSKNPLEYQQLINWIKSNAEVISETIKKVDEIENDLKIVQKAKPLIDNKPQAQKPVPPKQKTAAVPKSPEKPKTVISETVPAAKPLKIIEPSPAEKSKPLEKSKPVQVKTQEKSKPSVETPKAEVKAKPVVEPAKAEVKPKPAVALSEPEVQSKPVVKSSPPEIKTETVTAKPETVKLIFHRVEKGETLYRISRKYGITVEKLQELNDMKKEDLLIDIGQELIVRSEKQ